MTDPINTQPIQQVLPLEKESDLAGAAAVTPSYIPSEVLEIQPPEAAIGTDNVQVSAGAPATQPTIPGILEKEEVEGYIKSEISMEPKISDLMEPLDTDIYAMNTIKEINNAWKYIDPNDPAIQALIQKLKDLNVITSGMTGDEVALSIHNYMVQNFSYTPDKVGDLWYSVSDTIKYGGGDCEDLANLEASLITAALMDKGMTRDEASQRVGCVIVGDIATGAGHVYVSYVDESGTLRHLDPSDKGSKWFSLLTTKDVVLFSYSAKDVWIIDTSLDYSKLATAGYVIPATQFGYVIPASEVTPTPIAALSYAETRLEEITNDVWEVSDAAELKTLSNFFELKQLLETDANRVYNKAYNDYYNKEDLTWGLVLVTANEIVHPDGVTLLSGAGTNCTPGCISDAKGRAIALKNALASANAAAAATQKAFNDYINKAETLGYINSTQKNTILNSFMYSVGDWNDQIRGSVYTQYGNIVGGEIYYGNDEHGFFGFHYYDDYEKVTVTGGNIGGWGSATIYTAEKGTLTESASKSSSIGYQKTLLDNIVNNHVLSLSFIPGHEGPDGKWVLDAETPIPYNPTVDSLIGSLIVKQGNYYYLNTSNTFWNCLRAEQVKIKGFVMIISLVYEAKRNLRDLVNQELRGAEEGGYKGMDIPKLFQQKVQRADSGFTRLIGNVLKLMNIINQAVYQKKTNEINVQYDKKMEEQKEKEEAGIFEADYWSDDAFDAQYKELDIEKGRCTDLKGAAGDYQAVVDKNKEAAISMLKQMGMEAGLIKEMQSVLDALSRAPATTSTTKKQKIGIGNLQVEVDIPVTSTDVGGLSKQTTDTSDDNRYLEFDDAQAEALRNQLVGAGQQVRMRLMGAETLANMRNLVHQEMTGISGRSMRTDITSALSESEQANILTWFDQAVDLGKLSVQLENTETYYQINIEKYEEKMEAASSFFNRALNYTARIITAVTTIVGAIFGGAPGAAIGYAIGSAIKGLLNAASNMYLAFMNLSADKSHNDVIKPTAYSKAASASKISTGDPALDIVIKQEAKVDQEIADMTESNYLVTYADGGASGSSIWSIALSILPGQKGSSAFDSTKFAAAQKRIADYQAVMMIVNGIRADKYQLRNLVHQEMTGIGGRAPSNILTYAMEAARGQMQFVVGLKESNLQDMNSSRNAEFQRNKALKQAAQNLASSISSFLLSFLPVIGPTIAAQMDNYIRKQNAEDAAKINQRNAETKAFLNGEYSFSYEFGLPGDIDTTSFDNLVKKGLLKSDTGQSFVDYDAVSTLRKEIKQNFIRQAVLGSIKKTIQDMRNIAHMEMTGISGRSGGDFLSQINSIKFESAMRTLDLITAALEERARVENKALEAQREIDKIKSQISTTWTTGILSAALAIAAVIPGIGPVMASILAAAAQIVSAIGTMRNAYLDYYHAKKAAADDIEQVKTLLKVKKTMAKTPGSVEKRMEDLEEQALNEISDELIESLGAGTVGANRGLAAKYRNVLEKLNRREKIIKTVKDTMQNLRNMVHEVMSGISGISSNATVEALTMALQSAIARIDDAFKALDAVANRQNEISQAKRAEAAAHAQLVRTYISSSISIALAVISVAIKISESNAKTKYEKASGELDKANEGKDDVAKTNAKNKFNEARAEYAKYNPKVADPSKPSPRLPALVHLSNGIQYANMAVNLQMVLYQRDKMWEAEGKIEKGIDKQGYTKGEKTLKGSKVLEAMPESVESMEDIIAQIETMMGQDKLKAQAEQAKLQQKGINREFKAGINAWEKQVTESVAEKIKTKQDKTVTGLEDLSKSIDEVARHTNALNKVLDGALKDTAKYNPDIFNQILASISKETGATVKLVKETIQSSNALENTLIEKQNQLTEAQNIKSKPATIEKAKTEVTEAAKKLEDHIEALKVVQKTLKEAQGRLNEAMDKIRDLKQKLPDAANTLEVVEKELKKESDKIQKDYDDIDNRIKVLKEYGKKDAVPAKKGKGPGQIVKAETRNFELPKNQNSNNKSSGTSNKISTGA